ERLRAAVDDDLRRIDLTVAARRRIAALARRVPRPGQRVAPAEVIPIVDRKAESDDGAVACEVADEPVGRRARRAALAREELEHGARLAERADRSGPQKDTGNACGERKAFSMHDIPPATGSLRLR